MPFLLLALALTVANDVRHRGYLQNLKDGALEQCIANAYHASPDARADAEASAGGTMQEFTDFDFEHGGELLRRLIDRTLRKTYGSFQGPNIRLDLMKCIDLYHSRELDRLARRYTRRPTHSLARDYSE